MDYLDSSTKRFSALVAATCHCGAISYEVGAEPVDAKICHCTDCQTLHGAPMQWAAIFHKQDVRFTKGIEHLKFYHTPTKQQTHTLPCKVGCALCGSWIADEGRRMWLAFPTLFQFVGETPSSFRPTCHIFYGQRQIDVHDTLPKWEGHKEKSELLG